MTPTVYSCHLARMLTVWKERRSNKLKDYTTMAGPLGVTHLLLFSRSSSGNTNLRIAVTPRGPTLYFKIEKYSLCKDIKKSMKHPKGGSKDYLTAPLVGGYTSILVLNILLTQFSQLVMNNFFTQAGTNPSLPTPVPKHLESLTTSIFQSLFPPISPQSTPLASIRRVLLLNRETPSSTPDEDVGAYTINLRHYAITTKTTGVPKSIRRLNAAEKLVHSREKRKRVLPNLSKLEDVADYILDPSAAAGYTSASESEVETDAEVEVKQTPARQVLGAKQRAKKRAKEANGPVSDRRPAVEKRAVKLQELGPRMTLRLTKVEEGVCGGRVMWHEFVTKTKEEIEDLDKMWEERRKEKEARRKQQRENVERKRARRDDATEGAEGTEMDEDDWNSDDLEDFDGTDVEADDAE